MICTSLDVHPDLQSAGEVGGGGVGLLAFCAKLAVLSNSPNDRQHSIAVNDKNVEFKFFFLIK